MSERNWRDGYALVAVGLMLAAIVVVAALEIGARYSLNEQVGQPNATTTEQYQEQRGPGEGYWWPEFSARDTYAQWAMSILALAAVAISIVGVLLIRRTFEETKRTAEAAIDAANAALNANVISRDAQRPWLIVKPPVIAHLTPATFTENGVELNPDFYCFAPTLMFEILNAGASPATDVHIDIERVSRYVRLTDEQVEGKSVSWVQIDGVPYYRRGVEEYFEAITGERLINTGGIPAYTIGPGDRWEHTPHMPPIITISKEPNNLRRVDVVVVILAYRGLNHDDIFCSQFAFDLCGRLANYILAPPYGQEFANGDGIFYRQAESNVR